MDWVRRAPVVQAPPLNNEVTLRGVWDGVLGMTGQVMENRRPVPRVGTARSEAPQPSHPRARYTTNIGARLLCNRSTESSLLGWLLHNGA